MTSKFTSTLFTYKCCIKITLSLCPEDKKFLVTHQVLEQIQKVNQMCLSRHNCQHWSIISLITLEERDLPPIFYSVNCVFHVWQQEQTSNYNHSSAKLSREPKLMISGARADLEDKRMRRRVLLKSCYSLRCFLTSNHSAI